MFTEREPSPAVDAVRDEYAPEALVVDVERDFETLDPATAESLGLLVDALDPKSYPSEWVPDDAPEILHRLAGEEFTVGAPGDGGVAWTRQTTPPTVFVKPRLAGSPDGFVAFLVAEALVQAGRDLPETFLGFFDADYPALAAATPLSPTDTYQLAAALYEAYVGLHTRDVFEGWDESHPTLYDEWVDAGERLEPRLSDLSADVAAGRTEFPAAAEFACSAVKHGLDLPAPFSALDTAAYRHHGAAYAVQWAERTFDELA
ncbi:DUF7089 family protein [Halorarius halobius]|uniref:DUF7089 family protein n=1 Tax=Halorarius halobius TaxID=2962671 RepID=UPI0020CF1949|nr:hypothetical protein [Halorarius halobius]